MTNYKEIARNMTIRAKASEAAAIEIGDQFEAKAKLLADQQKVNAELVEEIKRLRAPVPLILFCPKCNTRHVDTGVMATTPHHTHACQGCGFLWSPAVVHTVGVAFLPGCRDADQAKT
jgi:hypothetical protein